MKDFNIEAFVVACIVILCLLGFSFLVLLVNEYSYILQVKLVAVLLLVAIGHSFYNHAKKF